MENEKGYPIKVVSRMTGLSPHVIRVWERRYDVVSPERTSGNRRLYNEQNIQKLRLLKKLVDFGYNISQIADFSAIQLKKMIEEHRIEAPVVERSQPPSRVSIDSLVDDFFLAIRSLDAAVMDKILRSASISFSQPQILEGLIIPVLERIGEEWQKGNFRIYHEHLVTTVIRSYLSDQLSSIHPSPNAPRMIVTTPTGQNHEIGALMVALTAAISGWNAIYLGSNLPSEEIAAVAHQKNCTAILLSIVYPPNDPILEKELLRLGDLIPENCQLIMGGRAASSYKKVVNKVKARFFTNLSDLRSVLQVI
jgi:DNA-binding transcriptional MerR regulator/methylmalonyl-CoA mutase cobalamin-binding subunit